MARKFTLLSLMSRTINNVSQQKACLRLRQILLDRAILKTSESLFVHMLYAAIVVLVIVVVVVCVTFAVTMKINMITIFCKIDSP